MLLSLYIDFNYEITICINIKKQEHLIVFWVFIFTYLGCSLEVRHSIRIKATKNIDKILEEIEELKLECMKITGLDIAIN